MTYSLDITLIDGRGFYRPCVSVISKTVACKLSLCILVKEMLSKKKRWTFGGKYKSCVGGEAASLLRNTIGLRAKTLCFGGGSYFSWTVLMNYLSIDSIIKRNITYTYYIC